MQLTNKTLVILALLLASCVSETSENYQQALNSWDGASYNDVVKVWGYPNQTKRAPSGNKLYVYSESEKGRNPVIETPGQTSVVTKGDKTTVSTVGGMKTGGGSYHLDCTTWFEVNNAGVVVNTSLRGNNCVADQSFVNSHSRNQTNG